MRDREVVGSVVMDGEAMRYGGRMLKPATFDFSTKDVSSIRRRHSGHHECIDVEGAIIGICRAFALSRSRSTV